MGNDAESSSSAPPSVSAAKTVGDSLSDIAQVASVNAYSSLPGFVTVTF